ncbi:3-oxoacid CoA-transferase subunit B [Xanthobacter oligotrophicus]|uniref:3-oxoacid CoA-transferase subunit B n=1 Tax=Xanthobacter oligotrophicus TaxID=2607286 RepID=UPI0011F2AC30|nr:3-oxoacid CoA-transferase subunit B [Xanthobacter oligotrophicus]MCG5236186.1 3-oxoacid CoA-transferase subunit B [Xanthobacter oligotrophicus]
MRDETVLAEARACRPRSREAMAQRAATDIPDGWYVNLGIGIPTLIANHVPADREVIFQSENGLLGIGPAPAAEAVDPFLINAGKQHVTLLKGAALLHQADSFAMIRGRHLDLCVLGAFQVAANGDIANWATSATDAAPAVGGAMDLALGARRVWVMMEHTTRDGAPRIVSDCTYPLTALGVVSRIYTNLAVIDITPQGLRLVELVEGLTLSELQKVTAAPLLA